MAEKIIPLRSLSATAAGIAVLPIAHLDPAPTVHREVAVPHRHDHYSCFFINQGTAEVAIDFQPLSSLTMPALLVSCPGQVHQVGPSQQFQGWILLADAKLVGPALRQRLELATARPRLLPLPPAIHAWFEHLLHALHAASAPAATGPLAEVETSHHLLNACLAQAAHLLEAQLPPGAASRRGLALTQAFRHLLRQHFRTWKKPAAYADQLHVTVSHLNDTVKATTGFSVSYFIQQEVLAEAQRLLCYTELTVQQVAEQLGYADAKYFSRLFTKGTGVVPSRFRQSLGELTA